METLKLLLGAGIVSVIGSLVTLLLQRKWSKDDKKESDNAAVMQKLSEIESKLDNHVKEDELGSMKLTRTRILAFNDELRLGIRHSEEHFADCLDDIDHYEKYCLSHPEYPNNKAQAAIRHIKEVYDDCLRKNSFL